MAKILQGLCQRPLPTGLENCPNNGERGSLAGYGGRSGFLTLRRQPAGAFNRASAQNQFPISLATINEGRLGPNNYLPSPS
jgi:hypothetical protein